MKRRYRYGLWIVLLICSMALVTAQQVERPVTSEEFAFTFSVEDYATGWLTGDSNGDGVLDYALRLDDAGEKRYEAVDFNFDGQMDDFYVYAGGVLARQEVDSNFDGAVDLWIYMHDGVRIQRYERDTNHDGVADVVRDFGES